MTRKKSRRYHLVLLFTVLAAVIWYTPIQHWVPLGRFQHYSISVFVFSLGYIAQTIFVWKSISKWGRFTYAATGMFFLILSAFFYLNPWLDPRSAIQEKQGMRDVFLYFFAINCVILAGIWLKLAAIEAKEKKEEIEAQESNQLINARTNDGSTSS